MRRRWRSSRGGGYRTGDIERGGTVHVTMRGGRWYRVWYWPEFTSGAAPSTNDAKIAVERWLAAKPAKSSPAPKR